MSTLTPEMQVELTKTPYLLKGMTVQEYRKKYKADNTVWCPICERGFAANGMKAHVFTRKHIKNEEKKLNKII